MIKLLEESKKSLELWVNLDRHIRDKFDKVISDFDWLTTKFFPLNVEDDELRTTIWTTEYKAFLEKKYAIDSILEKELKAKKSFFLIKVLRLSFQSQKMYLLLNSYLVI